jgi:hypothetical protein
LSAQPPEENVSFRPVAEVAVILASLREIDLSWIADEIENVIRRGKFHPAPRSEGTVRRGETIPITPYDEYEQLRITIRTLRNYFVEVPDLWIGTKILRELLGDSQVTVSIMPPDSDEPVLSPASRPDLARFDLNQLLRQAWPDGPDAYDRDTGSIERP